MLRKALQYQRLCGGVLRCTRRTRRSRAAAPCTRAPSAPRSGSRASRPSPSRRWSRATPRSPATRTRACTSSTSRAPPPSRPSPTPRQRGWRVSAEVCPHHLLLTEEDVRGLDTRMKMHPPLATEADRLALSRGCAPARSTASPPTTRRTRATRRRCRSSRRRWAAPAWRPRSPRCYTGLVLPGVLDLALLVERMTAGAALFELPTPTIALGAPANLTLVDLDAVWVAGEHGWESRSENCCFAGRRLQGRVLMTLAAGARRASRPRARDGGRLMEPARARPRRAGRRRRPGGLSPVRDLRRASPARAPSSMQAARILGAARARQRAVPQGARPHRARGRPAGRAADREDGVLRRARRGLRPRAAPSRRSCAASRRTCASARPSTTCSPRASRCTCPPTPSARATSVDYERGLERMERAGAVVTHRRGGAVRAARARRHAGVQGRPEADSVR